MAKFAGKSAEQFVTARSSRFIEQVGTLKVYVHTFTDTVGPLATVSLDNTEVRFHTDEAELKQELALFS